MSAQKVGIAQKLAFLRFFALAGSEGYLERMDILRTSGGERKAQRMQEKLKGKSPFSSEDLEILHYIATTMENSAKKKIRVLGLFLIQPPNFACCGSAKSSWKLKLKSLRVCT